MTSKKRKKKKGGSKKKKSYIPFWAVAGILALVVIFSYSPIWDADFVYWDDDVNVYENPDIQSLSGRNISNIFTRSIIGNYNPLPILTFAIEHAIYGMDPQKMHFTNLILHTFACLLIFFVGRRLNLSPLSALFVALLFALHPMRVESVAWITERKDVLLACFFWLSFLLYLKSYKNKRYYWYALLIFPLALLSKIQAVSLPLALLCADYLLKKKLKWSDVFSKWPFFLLSLITGVSGLYFLADAGSLNPSTTQDIYQWYERPIIGAFSYMVYLYKLVIPYPMSPVYPFPDGLKTIHYLGASAFLPLLPLCYWLWKTKRKTALFAFAFFTINVVFLLQVVGAGQGFIADRFTYIAYFGFFFWAGTIFQKYRNNNLARALALGLLMVYSVWTAQQAKIWQNSETMWSHVLTIYPNSPLALGNRGNYYRDNNLLQKAMADYTKAIQSDDSRHATYNSRAKLYFNSGQLDLALQDYNKAIELEPNKGEYYSNRGATHARLQNYRQAMQDLNKGIELDPNHISSYTNRAAVNDRTGNYEQARKDLATYLQYRPNDHQIWYNYGLTSMRMNDYQEALKGANQAINLSPNNGDYYKFRAKVYISLNQLQQARNDANTAAQYGKPLESVWQQKLQ
jgi:tetratricopeptide (TPR) repeat protein